MSLPLSFRLPACIVLSAAAIAQADVAWLDFQGSLGSPASSHQAFPATNGFSVVANKVTFTLVGAGVGSRSRVHEDEMLKDFAFVDGPNATLAVRIAGLPAGTYAVESWHFDNDYAGAVRIGFAKQGETPAVLVPNHLFAAAPATYSITSDGRSTYELTFVESDANNRVRLNGLHLRLAGAPSGLPGRFIEIDAANTTAVGGSPAPFFTDDPAAPGFTSGPLWRRRAGFGFDATGNRDVFEKDANGGLGDAARLVTTVTGLTPGATHPVYVAYLSSPRESWRIRAGLSPDDLTLFTPALPADHVTDLGPSSEAGSNRNQYLGFLGDATVGADGTLRLYSDDGDTAFGTGAERSWLDGFYLDEPLAVPAAQPGEAVSIVPDGAWTWFNDERAIVHDGFLYVGYVKADGQAGITRHELATGESRHMLLGTAASAQKDDHNNPSLTVLPDGRLLALYSKHLGGSQYYQRTSLAPNPASASDWGPEIVRRAPANNTYANTYLLPAEGDRIYNFHRCINFNPTLTISNDLGATWQPSRQFIKSGAGGIRPYTRFASNHLDRIDAIYTDGHPRDVANSLYHLYYKDGAFRRTDGRVLKAIDALPLDHDLGECGTVIYEYRDESWGPGQGPNDWIPAGRAWNWDVHQDKDGHPVAAFQVQRDNVPGNGWNHDRIFYYYARWTGAEWQKRFIAHAGRPLYAAEDDYGGGMALDPSDPNVVYISSNAADPFNLGDTGNIPLRANDRYEIWRGVTADGGLTFTWTQITVDSPADNLRPIVPENHGRPECLLWFHGGYGSYTSYSTQILARIAKPAPVAVAPVVVPDAAPVAPSAGSTTPEQPAPPVLKRPEPASKNQTQRNPVRR